MNKNDLFILLLVIVLLLAAILTIIRGGEQSKHGYGELSVTSSGSLFAAFAARALR
ncbi:MAG: hypothetical protein R6W72_07805 [Desulfurivibrionaceae bacterium]